MPLPAISKVVPSLVSCWSWPCFADLFLTRSWLCHITTDFSGHLGSWMMMDVVIGPALLSLLRHWGTVALIGEGNALPAFLSPSAPGSFSTTVDLWQWDGGWTTFPFCLEISNYWRQMSYCRIIPHVLLSFYLIGGSLLWKLLTQPHCKALWGKKNANGLLYDMHVSYAIWINVFSYILSCISVAPRPVSVSKTSTIEVLFCF